VRNAGPGLKRAKDLVEGTPKDVKEGVGRNEAEKIKAALEKVGLRSRSSVLGNERSTAFGNKVCTDCLEWVTNGCADNMSSTSEVPS
jgi:hypothetical protein